jgi:hypothetical protein
MKKIIGNMMNILNSILYRQREGWRRSHEIGKRVEKLKQENLEKYHYYYYH